MNENNEFMRAKEVANKLRICQNTVWNYAKTGKLTAIKLSARVTVFDVKEINALLNR